ncbi:hypothetical protein AAKU61_004170 [Undibacterium sp. GrIS 1.2]|uniref:hypothetical protein n=1 Tax=Undibacterium sp. GrIS 1.2 TaxID=3143933 RepID=UPI0033919A92
MKISTCTLLMLSGVGLCAIFYFSGALDLVASNKLEEKENKPISSNSRPGINNWGVSPFVLGGPVKSDTQVTDKNIPNVIYGRNGRAVDFGGLTASDFISKWSSLARAGNQEAAYHVYQAESVCANNDDAIAKFENAADREQFLREREDLQKICKGVTPAQVHERLYFLSMAARGGNVKAQIDFYMEGPYGKSIDLIANRDDPIVQQWKEGAVSNLVAAAQQGEPFAMALLAQVYLAGELLPRDTKMSLTYTVADAIVRNVNISEDQLRRRFGPQMSAADFETALQAGKYMANECCKK